MKSEDTGIWDPSLTLNTVINSNVEENTDNQSTDDNKKGEVLIKDQAKFIHLDGVPDFSDRSEIKPWLQKIFYPQGIELAIERSDTIKVVFKCKAAKRGKNLKFKDDQSNTPPVIPSDIDKDKDNHSLIGNGTSTTKKKRSVSRFNTCPFRIRATFSIKRQKWNVVVINNNHSHALKFNPDSDDYKKFKEFLRSSNDIDAVKRFDELEYRTRLNLPIEPQVIPCDCGLTNEIESFDIVLPTTINKSFRKSIANTTNSTSTCIQGTTITKPKKSKKKKVSLLQTKENLLKKTTTQNFLSNHDSTLQVNHMHNHSDQSSISNNTTTTSFIDDIFNISNKTNVFLPSSSDVTTDLNEIDFTEVFNKPYYNHHHHRQDDFLKMIDSSPSLLQQQMHHSTSENAFLNQDYMSPSDEFISNPNYQDFTNFDQSNDPNSSPHSTLSHNHHQHRNSLIYSNLTNNNNTILQSPSLLGTHNSSNHTTPMCEFTNSDTCGNDLCMKHNNDNNIKQEIDMNGNETNTLLKELNDMKNINIFEEHQQHFLNLQLNEIDFTNTLPSSWNTPTLSSHALKHQLPITTNDNDNNPNNKNVSGSLNDNNTNLISNEQGINPENVEQ